MKVINVEDLGNCTLVPFSILPKHKSSYENLLASVQALGLREIPIELTEAARKNIVSSVAKHVGNGNSLLISGTLKPVLVYRKNKQVPLNWDGKGGKMKEDCVYLLNFTITPDGEVVTSRLTVETKECINVDNTYCLFLGGID